MDGRDNASVCRRGTYYADGDTAARSPTVSAVRRLAAA